MIPRAWRTINHWYARANHYYWLPCRACGAMFGGHEVLESALCRDGAQGLPNAIHYRMLDKAGLAWASSMICPDCILAGYGQDTPGFRTVRQRA